MLKTKLVLILIGVIILLGALVTFEHNRAKSFKEQAEDREAIMNIKERDWKTKEGRLVHENSVIKLQSDKVAKELFKNDSLLKDLNIKWNKVHSLSKTTVENHYHISTPLINNKDSTYTLKEWKNTWLTVNGQVDLKKNSVSLDYEHKDTITQVIHYKRSKKFLGIIGYGKFEFLSQTVLADSSSKVKSQITYIKNK